MVIPLLAFDVMMTSALYCSSYGRRTSVRRPLEIIDLETRIHTSENMLKYVWLAEVQYRCCTWYSVLLIVELSSLVCRNATATLSLNREKTSEQQQVRRKLDKAAKEAAAACTKV